MKFYNISKEDIEKYNLTTNKLLVMEYIYRFTPKFQNINVTSIEVIMEKLPIVGSKRTLINILNDLEKYELLMEVKDDKLRYQWIKEYNSYPVKDNYLGIRCEWCNSDVFVTESHHYPIRAKDGGKETVNICANCHRHFHSVKMFKLNKLFIKNMNFILDLERI